MNTKSTHVMLMILSALVLAACGSPAPEATPVAARPAEPAEVVLGFWDAMQAQDLDAALAFVADDFQCRGSCYFSGKESLRFYLQGLVDGRFETAISELQVDGDRVSYAWEIRRNGLLTSQAYGEDSMQVQDGLIVFWENLRP